MTVHSHWDNIPTGPSLLKDRIHVGTEKGFKFCSPSLPMVTSPYKRTILERNKQTNKQTKTNKKNQTNKTYIPINTAKLPGYGQMSANY